MSTINRQNSPTVSVIIPVFNSQKLITRAVKSVLNGYSLPTEILILDDGSSDDTFEHLKDLEKISHLVKLFRFETNLGAAKARNFLLKKARGEYIAFLDADDEWYPNKLSTMLRYITEKDVDVCLCYYDVRDESNRLLGTRRSPTYLNYPKMLANNWIPMSMAMVRASLNGAGVMPDLRRRQDYGYWLKIFKENKNLTCLTIPQSLGVKYRQKTSLSSGQLGNIIYNYIMFRKFMGFPWFLAAMLVLINGIVRLTRI